MADDVIGRVRAVALACETATEAVHLYGADKDGHARDLHKLLTVAEAARAWTAAHDAYSAALRAVNHWRNSPSLCVKPAREFKMCGRCRGCEEDGEIGRKLGADVKAAKGARYLADLELRALARELGAIASNTEGA